MDMFERLNSRFGKWYEGLFGAGTGDLRPGDVLRKIQDAMEDNRVTHFDGRVYVPNKYVLELAMDNPQEYDYLLTFVDAQELVPILRAFLKKHSYETKGGLDITIVRVPEGEREGREKLRVTARFDKDIPSDIPIPEPVKATPVPVQMDNDDPPTVANMDDDSEPYTIPAVGWASLAVTFPDGRSTLFTLNKPTVAIGRSRSGNNDLVLDNDGQVSKSHARLERENDGHWTLYDLGSTNGVKVGPTRIDNNRTLRDGDMVTIGATTLLFHEADPSSQLDDLQTAPPIRRARLITPDGTPHVLASETLIGRAVTSDIVLTDLSVSSRHARVISPSAATYLIEDLGSTHGTLLNGTPIPVGTRVPLTGGDILRLGDAELRFTGSMS